MKKIQIAKWVMFGLALATNIFILVNGFIVGEASAAESGNIAQFLASIINSFAPNTINDGNFETFAFIMRKLVGHFGLFAVDAVFSTLAIYFFTITKKWYKFYWLSMMGLGTGFIVAILSELAQIITPDRVGSWADVGVDFGGFFLGFAIVILVLFLSKKLIASKSDNI